MPKNDKLLIFSERKKFYFIFLYLRLLCSLAKRAVRYTTNFIIEEKKICYPSCSFFFISLSLSLNLNINNSPY